jgi:hypothetical protein
MAPYIKIDNDGNKLYYKDKEMTILHREDGPAIEWVNGGKFWYRDGELYREDGPAIEWSIDEKERYKGCKFHMEHSPAVELPRDENAWYLNGGDYPKPNSSSPQIHTTK